MKIKKIMKKLAKLDSALYIELESRNDIKLDHKLYEIEDCINCAWRDMAKLFNIDPDKTRWGG